ncbi:MAG: hypothetical protein Tsb0015_05240 [Simkaniaceae bacterium]
MSEDKFTKENILFFLLNYKKQISYAAIALVIGLGIIVRIAYNKTGNPKDYALAQNYYSQWKETKNEKAFQELLQILKRHPELYPKYDVLLGQKLIFGNNFTEAKPILRRTIQRTKKAAPKYYLFSQATEKILDNDLREALELSLQIKSQANEDSYLYGLNLMRIAHLYSQLEDKENEENAWKEVRLYLTSESDPKGVKHSLREHFTQGKISLCDFISIKELKEPR